MEGAGEETISHSRGESVSQSPLVKIVSLRTQRMPDQSSRRRWEEDVGEVKENGFFFSQAREVEVEKLQQRRQLQSTQTYVGSSPQGHSLCARAGAFTFSRVSLYQLDHRG